MTGRQLDSDIAQLERVPDHVPDHVPDWVTESLLARAVAQRLWWQTIGGGLELPLPDRGELRRQLQRLAPGLAGVVSADGTNRFAQVVRMGDGYVLEVGANDLLMQISAARPEPPRFYDYRSLQRVDGRDVTLRVGRGWVLHLYSAADHAWRWVTAGQVSGDVQMHAVQ